MAGVAPPTPFPQNPGITGSFKVNALGTAAAKYHVPVSILWGVYGIETGFGKVVHTSSTGAMGHFQFEPGTARKYNYPLTNSPTPAQFQAQANGAAHYLSDLYHLKGKDWNRAIHAYSAGPNNSDPNAGYGLDAVKKQVQQNPSVFTNGEPGGVKSDATPIQQVAAGPIGGAAAGAFDGMKAIGAFFLALLKGDTWVRILKVVGGAAMLYLALIKLGAPVPSKLPPIIPV